MPDLPSLGDFEQLVLLALLRLGDDAYGVPIREEIQERAGRVVSLGSVYKTLERLEVKGYVSSFVGEPTNERGGRRKSTSASNLTAGGCSCTRWRRSGG